MSRLLGSMIATLAVTFAVVPPTAVQALDAHATAARKIDPSALPSGPKASLDFLQGRTIHTAAGERIKVKVRLRGKSAVLLGRSGNRWLVAIGDGRSARVVAVRQGQPVRTVKGTKWKPYDGELQGYRLSPAGDTLVMTNFNRGGGWTQVRDLRRRKTLGTLEGGYFALPLAVDTGRVMMWGEDPRTYVDSLLDWRPPAKPVARGFEANAVFIEEDVAFKRVGRRYGPTALTDPGTPAWSAEFEAMDLAPDGAHVLGYAVPKDGYPGTRAQLQVRRMSDGAVIRTIRLGKISDHTFFNTPDQTVRWESPTAYVFEVRHDAKSTLVRCDLVTAACERASRSGGPISVPHEQQLFGT